MEITRSELYHLVCEKPLSKVAPQLGISGTALAAVRKRHVVPYPGSGHWTRISLGMPVSVQPLPPSEQSIITIPPARPKRTIIKTEAEEGNRKPDSIRSEEKSIVKQRLSKPHPIISDWLQKHERRRREVLSSRDPHLNVPPPLSEIEKRRHRLLDATFKELEARGGAVSDNVDGSQTVKIDGEKIEFQIREKMRQSKTAVFDREKFLYTRGYRTGLVGTGYLVFAIKTYLRGRHIEEYLETDRLPLERQLPRISHRLFDGAAILNAWYIEQEAERERWRQKAAKRAELQRLAKEEEERWSRFVAAAEAWQTSQVVTQFIPEMGILQGKGDEIVGDKSIPEWLNWAQRRAIEDNPLADGVVEFFDKIK